MFSRPGERPIKKAMRSDARALHDTVVPVEGYDDLKTRLLCGELERFGRSLEWIDPHPGGSLLDLGACGDLVPAYQTALGYRHIVCVTSAGPEGRQRLAHRNGSIYEFDLYRLDLEREPYPFPDAEFDQVVAMEVIEHLAVDPMFMLAEANRVLKPGGRLLLTTPNINSLACLYHQLWGRHPALGAQAFGPGIMDRHHREYSPREIRDALSAAGFAVQRLDTFDPAPPNESVRRTGSLLKVLSWLKPGIDTTLRGSVIRSACVKKGGVAERFPRTLYPRYPYYDYAAYDRALTDRFGGRRYWQTDTCPSSPG
jgi:SAM-dependent methyltransferase